MKEYNNTVDYSFPAPNTNSFSFTLFTMSGVAIPFLKKLLPGRASSRMGSFSALVIEWATTLNPTSSAFRSRQCARRKKRIQAVFIAVLSVVGVLNCLSCTDDPDVVAINENGDYVPGALDLQSCEIIAKREFSAPSAKMRVDYERAIKQGKIIQLKNGTRLKQRELLNYKNMHLVPWAPPAAGEGVAQGTGVYEWMIPETGPHAGNRVCLPVSMRRGTHASL